MCLAYTWSSRLAFFCTNLKVYIFAKSDTEIIRLIGLGRLQDTKFFVSGKDSKKKTAGIDQVVFYQ